MGNKELGDLGEEHAARSLTLKGYSIIARKFRCRFGEIDIIALDRGTLAFIEVRSRSDEEYGLPYETINHVKKRRIRKVAAVFQLKYGFLEHDSRFDCVSVIFDKNGNIKDTEIIKDAFWS
ncbi:MAG: YraN family protein [Candidatus Omnitrophica bacterium]|nr:YraN family protein [Candidatus Omnitrophota bacterium]